MSATEPTPTEDDADRVYVHDHEFRPVAGHPDDDECTHRSDDTDATYCGRSRDRHLTDLDIAHIADDLGVRLIEDPRFPPAVPDTGDVDALAGVLGEADRHYDWPSEKARHVLASDWLAAHDAEVRRGAPRHRRTDRAGHRGRSFRAVERDASRSLACRRPHRP
ncbi:hypothetical protein [Nocardioides sp. LHG3406-4]|uniref:hypothetical protein n=1 Tax=Nocardioides sp. LHG3406-4 TaxID=2804575 RepID=UPI003CF6A512